MGIIFAVTALLAWGVGDFLIQKSARRFGNWIALFFVSVFGSFILLPFIYDQLASLWHNPVFPVLLLLGLITLVSSLLDFQALKVGKISVVEPIFSFEVVITASLAYFFSKESLTLVQISLIGVLVVGLFLVSAHLNYRLRHVRWERGVFLAVLTMITMGVVNYLFAQTARDLSPLVVNWFLDVFIAATSLLYIIFTSQLERVKYDLMNYKKLILSVSILDEIAWIAFAYGVLYAPIAIVTSISESYIALASVLGLVLNKEKLKKHQLLGLVIVFVSIVFLSMTLG